MGNQINPIYLKLGKSIFWKSELYSYYYTNVVSNYLKINMLLKNVFNSQRLNLISSKYFFYNNSYLFLTNNRITFWKIKCLLRQKCKFTVTKNLICTKVSCLFYKKAWWKKKKVGHLKVKLKRFIIKRTLYAKAKKIYLLPRFKLKKIYLKKGKGKKKPWFKFNKKQNKKNKFVYK
jgi:hypothetical protein